MATRINGINVSDIVGEKFFKIRDPDGYYYDIHNGWVESFYSSSSWKKRDYAQNKLLRLSNPDYGTEDLQLVEYKVVPKEVNSSSPCNFIRTRRTQEFGFPDENDKIIEPSEITADTD